MQVKRRNMTQVTLDKIKKLEKKVDRLKWRLLIFKLRKCQARVDKVHIDGVSRTKDDILVQAVQELFDSTNFEQVLLGAHSVRKKLETLGAFKHISILIDTSKGADATKDGLEVTFHVLEAKRVTGGINTQVGDNDGSLVLGIKMPNVFGRGEALQTEVHYGTKSSSGFDTTFSKPFLQWGDPRITGAIFQRGGDFPWSGFKQIDRGLLAQLSLQPHHKIKQSLQWEGVWRELSCLSQATSFAVREHAGHSLKSSLKHSVIIDSRDNPIIPNDGGLLKLTQEFAGLGGDISFLKHEAECQINMPLFLDMVLQGSFRVGLMHSPFPDVARSKICDRFFLGGPLTLRGFDLNGAGPHSDENALGSDSYWNAGVHLYTPLPFRPGQGGIGDYFRTHIFADVGNIGRPSFDSNFLTSPYFTQPRWSFGIGLVLSIGHVARFELNYCFPRNIQSGDKAKQGLQFGIGITYL